MLRLRTPLVAAALTLAASGTRLHAQPLRDGFFMARTPVVNTPFDLCAPGIWPLAGSALCLQLDVQTGRERATGGWALRTIARSVVPPVADWTPDVGAWHYIFAGIPRFDVALHAGLDPRCFSDPVRIPEILLLPGASSASVVRASDVITGCSPRVLDRFAAPEVALLPTSFRADAIVNYYDAGLGIDWAFDFGIRSREPGVPFVTFDTTPEPETFALFASGLAVLGGVVWRRRTRTRRA